MSEEESTNQSDEKKRPKLVLRGNSDDSTEKPEKVLPETGKLSEVDADTSKLELDALVPGEVDASMNATIRIDADEAMAPLTGPEHYVGDTQPMDDHPGSETARISEDEVEIAKGKTGPIKSDTTKLSLDDALDSKDTGKIVLEPEQPEPGMGKTMEITDLGVTSDMKSDTTRLNLDDALKERETKSPAAGGPKGEGILEMEHVDEDAAKSTTMPLGGIGGDAPAAPDKTDDELLKSATVDMKDLPDDLLEMEHGKEDALKSTTMPIGGIGGDAPATPDKLDDELLKSATVDMKDLPDDLLEMEHGKEDALKSTTMPLGGIGGDAPATPDKLDDELLKSATVDMKDLPEDLLEREHDKEDAAKSTTMPLGGIGGDAPATPDKLDDELLKSATVDMKDLPEDLLEMEHGKEDALKSTTMPIGGIGGEPPAADLKETDQPDEEFFKSATVPIKDLPEGEGSGTKNMTMNLDAGNLAAGAAAAAGAGERPQTIKIKKPGAKQLDTVKLQKTPGVEDLELQTRVTEATPPNQKKTVKLKRDGGGTAARKTMAISRPPGEADEDQMDAEEAVVGGPTMPGTFFSILALLSFFLTCGGLYYLYTAFNTLAGI